MAEFINTIDQMGYEVAEDAILSGEITELRDDRIANLGTLNASSLKKLETIDMPLVTRIGDLGSCVELKTAKFLYASNLGPYAMQSCKKLEMLHVPKMGKVEDAVFHGCSALKALILSNVTVFAPLSRVNSFQNTPIESGTGYIYVRKKFLDQYKSATNWSTYASQFRAIEDYPEIKAIVDADLAEMRGEAT